MPWCRGKMYEKKKITNYTSYLCTTAIDHDGTKFIQMSRACISSCIQRHLRRKSTMTLVQPGTFFCAKYCPARTPLVNRYVDDLLIYITDKDALNILEALI